MKSKINILLLEDEQRIGELYVKGLKDEGFKVQWAKTTLEAEALAKSNHFDVFLLDHGIKGEGRSGMDLIPTLKALLPESKIIILSNYNLFQLEEKRNEEVHYMLKIDTSPLALAKKIDQFLIE